MYVCTDATAGANVWTNVGAGTGNIQLVWYGERGLFIGGTTNSAYGGHTDTIGYATISTPGNATDFGNLTNSRMGGIGTAGNGTRLVMVCGSNNYPTSLNTMDYVTVATIGNATDFGDLTVACRFKGGASDASRGVYPGGFEAGSDPGALSSIDYSSIATPGNATAFGNLTATGPIGGAWSNGTRYLVSGVGGTTNVIEYGTIQTTGNSTDFGDRTHTAGWACGGSGNGTRYIMSGTSNVIDYVTMATTGNATDFGDMTRITRPASSSNGTRLLNCGGRVSGSATNTIDYIACDTLGNATDFGDMTVTSEQMGSGSGT
jgi:hypothetical protein